MVCRSGSQQGQLLHLRAPRPLWQCLDTPGHYRGLLLASCKGSPKQRGTPSHMSSSGAQGLFLPIVTVTEVQLLDEERTDKLKAG